MYHHITSNASNFLDKYSSLNWIQLIFITSSYLVLQSVYRRLVDIFHRFRSFWYDDLLKDYTNSEADKLNDGPYPNGWIPVTESQQLASGAVIKVHALGRDIVLVRDSNGKVHAMDPYCPHNGAHLGSGEIVEIRGEECLRCPFHEWSFRVEDGVCIDVPYSKDRKPPKGSSLKLWHCVERNSFIYIWFHNRERAPTWFPEKIEEIESKKMVYYDRLECIINTDLHLIAENTSDYAHFVSVHNKPSPLGDKIAQIFGLKGGLLEHVCDKFQWNPLEKPNIHQAVTLYEPHYKFFGKKIANASVFTLQSGPCIYTFRLRAQFFDFTIRRILVVGITPVHANKQRLVVRMYTEGNILTRMLDRLLLLGSFNNFHGDCEIWQYIQRLDKPLYLREEKTMVGLRRWFMQFYDGVNSCILKDSEDW
ncbi:cholesterol 7-desaturase nvd-like [Brevipalpus obovatus]|uniref:cholesterol 7-desaturase nvd-like n=1 Tax=Brevipalpus obovatus TaxID=246614 RepID=UPI003D9F5DC5